MLKLKCRVEVWVLAVCNGVVESTNRLLEEQHFGSFLLVGIEGVEIARQFWAVTAYVLWAVDIDNLGLAGMMIKRAKLRGLPVYEPCDLGGV